MVVEETRLGGATEEEEEVGDEDDVSLVELVELEQLEFENGFVSAAASTVLFTPRFVAVFTDEDDEEDDENKSLSRLFDLHFRI